MITGTLVPFNEKSPSETGFCGILMSLLMHNNDRNILNSVFGLQRYKVTTLLK